MTDAVPGFDVTMFSPGGRTHEVFPAGAGPAVIVVDEMPGLRFSADRGSPVERFATLRRELGDSFEAVVIDSSPGNPHGIRKERALGAHRGTGGRVRSYDSGRAGPGDGLPRRTAAVVTGRPTRRPRPASRR